MPLKKYLGYSFATLWTMVLIIALVGAIVHQVKFQDSAKEIHLKVEVATLTNQLIRTNSILKEKNQLIRNLLDHPYYE